MISCRKEEKMSWISDKIERFRQMPNPYFALHIISGFLFGVGLGLLLATWLPIWTGWMFIIVAIVIAIPSTKILLGK